MKAFRFKVKIGHLGFVCFVLYKATISGERLQDHWSSGFQNPALLKTVWPRMTLGQGQTNLFLKTKK